MEKLEFHTLVDVDDQWAKSEYVPFSFRKQVIRNAAVGLLVQKLIERNGPLASALKTLRDTALNNLDAHELEENHNDR